MKKLSKNKLVAMGVASGFVMGLSLWYFVGCTF